MHFSPPRHVWYSCMCEAMSCGMKGMANTLYNQCKYQIASLTQVQEMWVFTGLGLLMMLVMSGSSLCGLADTAAPLQITWSGPLSVTLVPPGVGHCEL